MTFGPADPDLLPGAHNAVNTCLAVRPGEHVALIADEQSRWKKVVEATGAKMD